MQTFDDAEIELESEGEVEVKPEGAIEVEMPQIEPPTLETGTDGAAPAPLPPTEERSAGRWLSPSQFNQFPTVTYSGG